MADTRTFVAAALDTLAVSALQGLTDRLRRSAWGGVFRWSAPDTWHLTIKFVGDVPEKRMEPLTRAVADAALMVQPFTFSLQGLGCFPSARRPNILWVGIEEPSGGLARLAQGVDTALAREGWPAETRPFHPHLTIARARSVIGQQQAAALAEDLAQRSGEPLAHVFVDRIIVYGSVLTPLGPVHTPLCVCPLTGA